MVPTLNGLYGQLPDTVTPAGPKSFMGMVSLSLVHLPLLQTSVDPINLYGQFASKLLVLKSGAVVDEGIGRTC